jgi:hypothetical protein
LIRDEVAHTPDGAYAIEGSDDGPFAFRNSAPDALCPGVKLGLYDPV